MLDLAQENVIDRAKNPRFAGRLEPPSLSADGANQSCGDEVHMEIAIQDGVMTQIRHQVRGCTVCAASADLLTEWGEGKSEKELQKLTPQEVQEMLGISLSPIRLKCALLPLETIREALSQTA